MPLSASTGMSFLFCWSGLRSCTPSMVGWLGPYRSASSTPTRAPILAIAVARLAVVVDLPTPPLPDATAIIFFTPLMVATPGWTLCVPISVSILKWICVSPVWAMTASWRALAMSAAIWATGNANFRPICRPSECSSRSETAFSLPKVRIVVGINTASSAVRMAGIFIICLLNVGNCLMCAICLPDKSAELYP